MIFLPVLIVLDFGILDWGAQPVICVNIVSRLHLFPLLSDCSTGVAHEDFAHPRQVLHTEPRPQPSLYCFYLDFVELLDSLDL